MKIPLGILAQRHFLETERGGFEPPVPLRVHRFSRPAQSTALSPLLMCHWCKVCSPNCQSASHKTCFRRQFCRHLNAISRHQFRLIPLGRLQSWVKSHFATGRFAKKAFRSMLDLAARAVPATFPQIAFPALWDSTSTTQPPVSTSGLGRRPLPRLQSRR
jgi:hypothetical protein